MNGLTERVKKWGIKRPDLRPIGAELVVRSSAKENGEVANAGQERAIRDMALKHGEPKVKAEPEIKPEEVKVKEEAPGVKPEEAVKKKKTRKAAQDHEMTKVRNHGSGVLKIPIKSV